MIFFSTISTTLSFKIENSFVVATKGIIISGVTLCFLPQIGHFFETKIAASITALVCISYISGKVTASRHPLCPSIGLNSCNSSIFAFKTLIETPISLDISAISFSFVGKNSCRGGSRNLTVTGKPSMVWNSPAKSSLWKGRSLARAFFLLSTSFDKIISRIALILGPSKNICSVLHSPIPSAPNSLAVLASLGVSALVLMPIFRYSSAQDMSFPKFPESSGSLVSIFPT